MLNSGTSRRQLHPTSNSDVDGKENKKESFSLRNRTKDFGTEAGTKQLANHTARIGFSAITIQAG